MDVLSLIHSNQFGITVLMIIALYHLISWFSYLWHGSAWGLRIILVILGLSICYSFIDDLQFLWDGYFG